ncbi:hypothetical protein TNCV_4853091 [Trichonephila clavipes]|nr:hypothetical protein TNCV_4853091 [Trichonephila clavipes]
MDFPSPSSDDAGRHWETEREAFLHPISSDWPYVGGPAWEQIHHHHFLFVCWGYWEILDAEIWEFILQERVPYSHYFGAALVEVWRKGHLLVHQPSYEEQLEGFSVP